MTLALFAKICGIFGVVIIMIIYYLLQSKRIESHSHSYFLVNLIGALLIIFSLFFEWNLPSFLMESSWAVISAIGLYHLMKEKKYK